MPAVTADQPDAADRVRDIFARYTEPLLRSVASRLVKPRVNHPPDDLAAKAADMLDNAPAIDRKLRDLPDSEATLLRLIGRSHANTWPVGHLITLTAAAGFPDGFRPIEQLLLAGLLFPVLPDDEPVTDFTAWLGRCGTASARVFIPPTVAARARGLATGAAETEAKPGPAAVQADGLEWLLRLSAAWQQSRPAPVRMTQTGSLYKRDLTRLQTDPVLLSPFADLPDVIPDAGLLAFEWASAAGLFIETNLERNAAPTAGVLAGDLWKVLTHLFASLFSVNSWDPMTGYGVPTDSLSPTPTAGLILADLLAKHPATWLTAADLAGPLWEHHPSLAVGVPREAAKLGGVPWVEAWIAAIAYPLRLIEIRPGEPRRFRLSEFGRHLLANGPEPTPTPIIPQTLMVQPNAQMIAYRQGLSPTLVTELARFATWRQVGPACTLELTAEETYRGLESGLTLASIRQTLDRHALRPVPNTVVDLLKRWADKRERITIYPSATVVEFTTAADLETALARGIVSVKLTDRIGLTADGSEPEFKHLRLIGNRDFDAKPVRCVTVAADGVTVTVDAGQSDLLLDAEMLRVAEPLPESNVGRRYRLTPASLNAAVAGGMTLEELDRWFEARTGVGLSPAGRLFITAGGLPPATLGTYHVVKLPNVSLTDGVMQWPETSTLIRERLGPTAVVVTLEDFPALQSVLAELGLIVHPID